MIPCELPKKIHLLEVNAPRPVNSTDRTSSVMVSA